MRQLVSAKQGSELPFVGVAVQAGITPKTRTPQARIEGARDVVMGVNGSAYGKRWSGFASVR